MYSKSALRREMRLRRDTAPDRAELDSTISRHFLTSALYQKAECLLCYVSFSSEADTYGILETALLDGKAVYAPYCVPGTNRLLFYRIRSLSDLQKDAFGIFAPKPEGKNLYTGLNRALCVVPGLAFSRSGERLGYGRGYYDTFLNQENLCTVGLCYDFQIVTSVPTEPHDRKMHYLCTETGLRPCQNDTAF